MNGLRFRNVLGQLVTQPGYGQNQGWAAGGNLDLLTQAPDMHVYGLFAVQVGAVPPHRFHNLRPAEHLPAMTHQVSQQAKFGGGQVDRLSFTQRLAAGQIQQQIADGDLVGCGAGKLTVGPALLRAVA